MRPLDPILRETNILSVDHVEQWPLRIYFKDIPYPMKGLPTESAIKDIDRIKKLCRTPWKKREILALLKPHKLPWGQLTQTARAIISLGGDWATIIGYVLEYDQAYRFRLQDLANETDHLTPREVIRLFSLWRQRDMNEIIYRSISRRFTIPVYLFAFSLLNPRFSQRINTILPLLKPDESDLYWMKLKTDYNYGAS